jgi:hypothetical protein
VELVALLSVLASGVGMLGAIELRERPSQPLLVVELHFGVDLNTDVVRSMIGSVAGLPSNAVVTIDTYASGGGIRYFLRADQATLDSLRGQWRGVLPSLRVDEPKSAPLSEWSAGAVLRLSGSSPVLREDAAAESVASLLGALQPLGRHEALLWRVMLAPTQRPPLPEPATRQERQQAGSLRGLLRPYGGSAFRCLRQDWPAPRA